MVRFILPQSNNVSVEETMECVNNYINFNDLSNVENSGQVYSIKTEYEELFQLAGNVNRGYNISANRTSIIMAQGKFARVKVFIKKAIRKCIRWYINDIAVQQTNFNANVTRFINQELNIINKMNNEIVRLRKNDKFENSNISDEWYVDFENTFRGTREEIKKRLEVYIHLFHDKDKVIDLGCGRGEFLELLKANGIKAAGLDINGAMVELCKEQGFDVIQQDCNEFLDGQDNESLGGIFASQLVEHLSHDDLYHLMVKAYNKLKKGGIFVVETLNPLTLGVFCYGFYIDPSHSVPIHPAMLRFMAERIGFAVDPVGFVNEFPDEYKFIISEDMKSGEVDAFNKLNAQIFGAQDYYLVCRKG